MNPNAPLPRDIVTYLCEVLGHDPDAVSRIVLETDHVEVVYRHRVTDART